MCVYLGHTARLLEMLQCMFYSPDTQLRPVPEVLYCHPARVGRDAPPPPPPHCPLELLHVIGVVLLIHYRLEMSPSEAAQRAKSGE